MYKSIIAITLKWFVYFLALVDNLITLHA